MHAFKLQYIVWVSKIVEVDPNEDHLVEVVNNITGESISTRCKTRSSLLDVMPRSFFLAIEKCISNLKNGNLSKTPEVLEFAEPIVPQEILPVEEQNKKKVTAKWNGWKVLSQKTQ